MKLSVVVVNWNGKKFVENCINSIVLEINLKESEIIVVDNGSTDGSNELISNNFPYVKIIQNSKNIGFAAANNQGIIESDGQYLCFINSDIILKRDCINTLLNYIESNSDIGILAPKLIYPNHSLQISCKKLPSLWNSFCEIFGLSSLFPSVKIFSGEEMSYFDHDSIQNVNAIAGGFWMISRDSIKEVGLLDEEFFFYAEDMDWCKRFSGKNKKIVFNPNAIAIHHAGGSSSNDPIKYYILQRKARLQYWRKYHNKLSRICILIMLSLQDLFRIFIAIISYLFNLNKCTNKAKIKRSFYSLKWLIRNNFKLV
jgi:GT2 family glycosyltransferase